MRHIYCISGFGADERVFSKLDFGEHPVHFLSWFIPEKKESIEQYAKRMSENILHENPVLIGLSFGGIMSIEIAKIIKTYKIILISSVKSVHEIPLWMKLAGRTKLNKFLPLRSFRIIESIENYNLGIEKSDELKLVREYRRNISQAYTNWAIEQILHWKNEWQPENCIHIHGGKDHIFPVKNIKAGYIIPDGGHFMIMNRAEKVAPILKELLS